jgi:EmrB/QacA subfamily drug resistance transporter
MGKASKFLQSQPKDRRETKKTFVLVSVMLATFMGAIEATIVSTAMPEIVGELGGFSLYSWVFSAYLLMNAVTVLIYGKLADLFGRKPILIFGISIFLIGSILCGLATSMEMLIVYRLIQGVGAGAVTPVATTIIGDIYTKEERAKIQGYLSSVWGISAVSGPAIGGLLVEYVSWRYVFWINLPLGILAIVGILTFLHEKIEKKKHEIDYKGAILLTISVSSLMILLVEGGVNFAWSSTVAVVLVLTCLLAFGIFIYIENKAVEPMMPFSVWREKSILIANLTSLTTGIILIGISSFLPAFVQGVMERPPIVAGFTLTAMSIGWPIASTFSGKLLLTIGFRKTSLIGGGALILGSILFATLSPQAGPLWAALGSFVIGIGMGLTTTAFIVSIQSTVAWEQRGVATASNSFMRNLGNTIGAALLGGVLNSTIKANLTGHSEFGDNLSLDSLNILLSEAERNQLTHNVKVLLQGTLTEALHTVYIVVLIFAVISMLLVAMLPKKD